MHPRLYNLISFLGPLDPFALIWSSITTFISTVINLLISEPENDNINAAEKVELNQNHAAHGHAEL